MIGSGRRGIGRTTAMTRAAGVQRGIAATAIGETSSDTIITEAAEPTMSGKAGTAIVHEPSTGPLPARGAGGTASATQSSLIEAWTILHREPVRGPRTTVPIIRLPGTGAVTTYLLRKHHGARIGTTAAIIKTRAIAGNPTEIVKQPTRGGVANG